MIAVMATAFVMLCNAVTTKDEPLVNRIRSTSIALYALDGEIDGRSTRTVVPAVHYIEFKSVYLEAKRYNKEHENPEKTARRDASPHHAANPEPRPPTVEFMVELRKKINEIHDASVLGKPPPDKRLRGLT